MTLKADRREYKINGHTIEIPFTLVSSANNTLATEIVSHLERNTDDIGWGKSFKLAYNETYYHFMYAEGTTSRLELHLGHK